MAERGDTDLFQVLIGQLRQDREIDVVLGKAIRVLGQSEALKPFHHLLHRRPRAGLRQSQEASNSGHHVVAVPMWAPCPNRLTLD